MKFSGPRPQFKFSDPPKYKKKEESKEQMRDSLRSPVGFISSTNLNGIRRHLSEI